MGTKLWHIQKAIYSALTASTAVQAGIYDDVPPTTATYPYIAFGEPTGGRFDLMGNFGEDDTLLLNIWSQYKGWKEAYDVLGAVKDALDYQPLSSTGITNFVMCRVEDVVGLHDPDGITRHLAVRCRCMVQ